MRGGNRGVGIVFIVIGLANVIIFRRSMPGLAGGVAFVVIGIVLLARSRRER
jgi:uncharacterized membrane protein YkgB